MLWDPQGWVPSGVGWFLPSCAHRPEGQQSVWFFTHRGSEQTLRLGGERTPLKLPSHDPDCPMPQSRCHDSLTKGDRLSWFAQDFPRLRPESPVSQETPQSQTKQDHGEIRDGPGHVIVARAQGYKSTCLWRSHTDQVPPPLLTKPKGRDKWW